MIEGVKIIPLRKIPDERGTIMHMMRNDDPHFEKFGEIYFSRIYPEAIKAFHVHRTMTLNYAVVIGMLKLVLYDMRKDSKTEGELMEVFMGDDNYVLVRVPPGIANGQKGMGPFPAILANCSTEPHDPQEMIRIDPFDKDIGYDWAIKHR